MKTFSLRSFACAVALLVAAPLGAETIRVGGTGGALGTMRLLGEAFKKENPKSEIIVVPGLGSGGGRRALLGGALDLAVTARPWKGLEKLDGAMARLYGRAPFVFAVPAKNPVNNLSIQEIIEIYGGKKTAWPSGERLRLVLRPLTDSDSEMLFGIGADMEQAVKLAHKREGMSIAITDEESANLIETTPGAIGTSITCLILAEKRPLKALAVKGVAATAKTIADGSYPWFKSYYILNKPEVAPAARAFADFVISPRAQQILAKAGHWLPAAGEPR